MTCRSATKSYRENTHARRWIVFRKYLIEKMSLGKVLAPLVEGVFRCTVVLHMIKEAQASIGGVRLVQGTHRWGRRQQQKQEGQLKR